MQASHFRNTRLSTACSNRIDGFFVSAHDSSFEVCLDRFPAMFGNVMPRSRCSTLNMLDRLFGAMDTIFY